LDKHEWKILGLWSSTLRCSSHRHKRQSSSFRHFYTPTTCDSRNQSSKFRHFYTPRHVMVETNLPASSISIPCSEWQ
jgi:hypothetical protein